MNRFAIMRSTKANYYFEPLYKMSKLSRQEKKLQNEIDKYFEDLIENEVLPARKLNELNNKTEEVD
jgi:hypothetical protein